MVQQGPIPPPPGVTPNFVDPEVRNTNVYPVAGVGLALSTTCLCIRLYAKTCINRFFGAEDVVLVLAWVFVLVMTILCMLNQIYYGVGRHSWDVTLEQYQYQLKVGVAATILYVPGLALAKISILLIFRRISPSRDQLYRWTVNGVIAFVSAFSLALILVQIFPCQPVAKGWDVTIVEGHCLNRTAIYLSIAAIGIATDVALLLLPIPILRMLQLPLPQKIFLGLMFMIGSVTLITSIIRVVTIVPLLTSMDQTWDLVNPTVWVIVEAHLLVICPSLMSFKAVLRRHAPSLLGESPYNDTNSFTRQPTVRGRTSINEPFSQPFNLRDWPQDIHWPASTSNESDKHSGSFESVPRAGAPYHSQQVEKWPEC